MTVLARMIFAADGPLAPITRGTVRAAMVASLAAMGHTPAGYAIECIVDPNSHETTLLAHAVPA